MKPVFILGILPRSGTNYLHDLISKHPNCQICAPPWEDHLLQFSHHLVRYSDYVTGSYDYGWGDPDTYHKKMMKSLGDGLLHFIQPHQEGKTFSITKNPFTHNIDNFFNLFPNGYLIVLIREGKNLAESYLKSVEVKYETVFRMWRESAQRILNFREWANQNNRQFHIVKYEDLFLNVEDELRAIFRYLEEDEEAYDYQAAENAEVIGSSTFRGGHNHVYFGKLQKDESFDPLRKWHKWTNRLHSRYNWMCGETAEQLGYPVELDTRSFYYSFYNTTKDLLQRAELNPR